MTGHLPERAFVAPRYQGRPVYEHESRIRQLKREDRLEDALALATGCMSAMIDVARRHPGSAMEHYVIEVCKIQHKLKRHEELVQTVETWFALGIPSPREDFSLDLRKRLAKARELHAKQTGADPSGFTEQWRALVEEQKALKARMALSGPGSARPATGRNAGTPAPPRRPTPRFIPPAEIFLSPEFVAVDFETANRRGGVSACQVSLARFSRGQVVDRLTTCIRPPRGWDRFEFTYLHGISARDTAQAPMWDELAWRIDGFVGGMPVYAHNASFDARVWAELDEFFGVSSLPDDFFCTYRIARRAFPGLHNHKLPTVVGHCAPQFHLDHHRAESDAEACGLIVAALQQQPDVVRSVL